MNWFRDAGWLEVILAGLFLVACFGYLLRIISINKFLGHKPPYSFWFKIALRAVIFGLFIIALLGPTFGVARKQVKSVGKDIIFCVDLSKSMDAFDVQPSRLEKVKYELKKIVEAFNSDRIGIIIFSSEAFMQCPLTYDQTALDLMLKSMNSGLVPNAGTDFAPPLKMAIEKFQSDAGNNRKQQRIVILVSDGEDFGEETESVAGELQDEGIRLFTLGVGTPEGSPIQTARGYKTDQSGQTVISRVNSKALRRLADEGGGTYFEIGADRNDVPRLISSIGSLAGEVREARQVDVSANRYFYFLLAALALMLLDLAITIKPVRL